MKRSVFLFSIVLLFCFSFFNACAPTEEQASNNTTPSPTDSTSKINSTPAAKNSYLYNENTFKDRYEKALSDVKGGEKLDSDAPTSPDETGFALIPLGEELYGINYLAILPVLTRDLTDTEIHQLAYKMDDISFEELISPTHSFMGGDTLVEYRPLQWEERVRRYGLERRFQFEELRPANHLANDAASGSPIYVDIKDNGKYWIYPKAAMTDEQLLEIIEKQFNVGEEYFQPLDTQIQYADLDKTLNKLILEYNLSDKNLEEYYPYYMTYRYIKGGAFNYPDYWYVRMHFFEDYDYNIKFFAEGGALISWTRIPKDYYDEKEPAAFTTSINNNKTEHTEEEVIKAAEAYVAAVILKNGITVASSNVLQKFDKFYYGGGLISECNGVYVNVFLSNNESYRIAVLTDDLSIQSVESQSSQTE
jgi:hypothetical protein